MVGVQQRGHVRVEYGLKRIRVLFGGEMMADTRRCRLVWLGRSGPVYYFPAGDVRTDLLIDTGRVEESPSRGTARVLDVKVGGRTANGAAYWYGDSPLEAVADTIRFDWSAMDAWFEEDEEVFVHPRDPYKRVDILQSSRHVRVEVGGRTVAESTQPRLLFETGLPVRHYLPKTDVRVDLLRPSDTQTRCPYKGTASYYHVEVDGEVYEDVVWWYPHPTLEGAKIAGYLCFSDERVEVYLDGEHQQRPIAPFS